MIGHNHILKHTQIRLKLWKTAYIRCDYSAQRAAVYAYVRQFAA